MNLSESMKYIPLVIALSLSECKKAPAVETLTCAEIEQRISEVRSECMSPFITGRGSKVSCFKLAEGKIEDLRKTSKSKGCK